jgi:hypothetical protein
MLNTAGNIFLGGSADLQLLTGGRWDQRFQVNRISFLPQFIIIITNPSLGDTKS